MTDFVKERDTALLSLNETRIKAYCKKYGISIPSDDEVFWRGVHKAICNIQSATPQQKAASAKWLVERGSTPHIQ